MKTEIDSKAILEKVRAEEMARVNFYLPRELYEAFQKECGKAKVPMSNVVAELLKSFLGRKG